MTKKLISLLLVFLINSAIVLPVLAQTRDKQEEHVSKIKAKVARRGTGSKAKVKVSLLDGTKVRGYISETGADNFTVVDEKGGGNVVVAYTQVKDLNGGGLSSGAKIGFGVAIGVVAFAVIIGLVNSALDD